MRFFVANEKLLTGLLAILNEHDDNAYVQVTTAATA